MFLIHLNDYKNLQLRHLNQVYIFTLEGFFLTLDVRFLRTKYYFINLCIESKQQQTLSRVLIKSVENNNNNNNSSIRKSIRKTIYRNYL
jgi:hypothetical protein